MSEINQTICLEGSGGWRWMDYFDDLHPLVRRYLRDASINICIACLGKWYDRLNDDSILDNDPYRIIRFIQLFESGEIHNEIRRWEQQRQYAQEYRGYPTYPPSYGDLLPWQLPTSQFLVGYQSPSGLNSIAPSRMLAYPPLGLTITKSSPWEDAVAKSPQIGSILNSTKTGTKKRPFF